jgi:hypothetical protein
VIFDGVFLLALVILVLSGSALRSWIVTRDRTNFSSPITYLVAWSLMLILGIVLFLHGVFR